jgi:hypothetical protein
VEVQVVFGIGAIELQIFTAQLPIFRPAASVLNTHRSNSAAASRFDLADCLGLGSGAEAEFPNAVFPVLGKNSAKTKESKQAFVGQPRNACLVRHRTDVRPAGHETGCK